MKLSWIEIPKESENKTSIQVCKRTKHYGTLPMHSLSVTFCLFFSDNSCIFLWATLSFFDRFITPAYQTLISIEKWAVINNYLHLDWTLAESIISKMLTVTHILFKINQIRYTFIYTRGKDLKKQNISYSLQTGVSVPEKWQMKHIVI